LTVLICTSGQLRQYDYKPFGDTLQSDSYNNLRGYEGGERDPESRYLNLGARLYDPIIGRFLSVDPLWEAFPSWSPYQYAYNCPISYKDPTGFAPQKEKGDRVMALVNLFGSYSECSGVVMAREDFGFSERHMITMRKFQILHEYGTSAYVLFYGTEGGKTKNTGNSSDGGRTASQANENSSGKNVFSSAWDFISSLFSGKKSEEKWEWEGVDYGSKEALLKAVGGPYESGLPPSSYTYNEVVCEADRINNNPLDYLLLNAVSISLGCSSIAGIGGCVSIDLYISQQGIFLTSTVFNGGGLDISPVNIDITAWKYTGNSKDLTMRSYETRLDRGNLGFYTSLGGPLLGGNYYESNVNNNKMYGIGISIHPFSYGRGSMGATNTFILGGWKW
jgi:RHS repeat-associated protein